MYVCMCGQFVAVLVQLLPQVFEDIQPHKMEPGSPVTFWKNLSKNAAVGILP